MKSNYSGVSFYAFKAILKGSLKLPYIRSKTAWPATECDRTCEMEKNNECLNFWRRSSSFYLSSSLAEVSTSRFQLKLKLSRQKTAKDLLHLSGFMTDDTLRILS